MIDLGLGEIDQAVVEALDRILAGAGGPGWQVSGARCALDRNLWARLTDLLVTSPDTPADERLNLLTYGLAAERIGRTLVGLPMIDHIVALRFLEAIGPDGAEARAAVGRSGAPLALLIPATQSRDAQPPLSMSGAVAGSVLRILPNGAVDFLQGEPMAFVENLGDLPVGRAANDDPDWRTLAEVSPDLVETAVAERKVLIAAVIAGICDRSLELAVEYGNTRELFGVPIGSFQSLAHGLASGKVMTDGTQLLAREAAWAADDEPARFLHLSWMAYAYAAAAGEQVTRAAVHIFGGYGLTREYPAQAYYRMARALCLFVGDRRFDLQKIGRDVIDDTQSRSLVGA
ncbi:MAG: uncharacterized protein JWR84_2113 [Caulobacter sp.]|nr:uncharacterized protein [Caulobacter sp.]